MVLEAIWYLLAVGGTFVMLRALTQLVIPNANGRDEASRQGFVHGVILCSLGCACLLPALTHGLFLASLWIGAALAVWAMLKLIPKYTVVEASEPAAPELRLVEPSERP